jgi:hypothetical protein
MRRARTQVVEGKVEADLRKGRGERKISEKIFQIEKKKNIYNTFLRMWSAWVRSKGKQLKSKISLFSAGIT